MEKSVNLNRNTEIENGNGGDNNSIHNDKSNNNSNDNNNNKNDNYQKNNLFLKPFILRSEEVHKFTENPTNMFIFLNLVTGISIINLRKRGFWQNLAEYVFFTIGVVTSSSHTISQNIEFKSFIKIYEKNNNGNSDGNSGKNDGEDDDENSDRHSSKDNGRNRNSNRNSIIKIDRRASNFIVDQNDQMYGNEINNNDIVKSNIYDSIVNNDSIIVNNNTIIINNSVTNDIDYNKENYNTHESNNDINCENDNNKMMKKNVSSSQFFSVFASNRLILPLTEFKRMERDAMVKENW